MDSKKELIKALTEKLQTFKSTPTRLEIKEVNPIALDRIRFNQLNPVDIDLLFTIKGESIRGAMIVTATESTAILWDKIRQIKEYVSDKPYILPFIGSRFLGEVDRNLAVREGVNLFDLAGNIYVQSQYLHFERIIPTNPFADKPTLKEVFSPVSSRLIRVLLVNSEKRWSLFELAREADVSGGLAHRIIKKLVEDKLIEREKDKTIIVKSPGEILDRWVRAKGSYKSYTQQKFSFYSYKKDIGSILKTITLLNNDQFMKYALSFSTGAYVIAPYTTTINKVQMYINHSVDIDTWKRMLDLTPVDKGANVEIYTPYDKGVFYGIQQVPFRQGNDKINVVSNVQLYLDLYNDPARGEEQAKHLREVKLHF